MYRNNGEYWYRDMIPLWMRLFRWFISIGGWQSPHWTQAGYTYRWQARHAIRLALRARGHRSGAFALYSSACPLSFFGGRLTFQPFGVSYWSRRVRGYYCLHWGHGKQEWTCYRSHDATPSGADTWYVGAPKEVIRLAQAQHDRMDVSRREREERDTCVRMRFQ